MMIFPRKTKQHGDCIVIDKEYKKEDYRQITYAREVWRANRLSYHLNCEPIPRKTGNTKEGMILHTCDYRPCINPDHLYLGSKKQNFADMMNRNRRNPSEERKRKLAMMTPEQRIEMMANAAKGRRPEQPKKAMESYNQTATREQRQAQSKKGWETRRRGGVA